MDESWLMRVVVGWFGNNRVRIIEASEKPAEAAEVLMATEDKGQGLECLLSSQTWYPIISVESVDGAIHRHMIQRTRAVVKQLLFPRKAPSKDAAAAPFKDPRGRRPEACSTPKGEGDAGSARVHRIAYEEAQLAKRRARLNASADGARSPTSVKPLPRIVAEDIVIMTLRTFLRLLFDDVEANCVCFCTPHEPKVLATPCDRCAVLRFRSDPGGLKEPPEGPRWKRNRPHERAVSCRIGDILAVLASAVEEWRGSICIKIWGSVRKKRAAISMLSRLIMRHQRNHAAFQTLCRQQHHGSSGCALCALDPNDLRDVSAVLQPFIISPAINIVEILGNTQHLLRHHRSLNNLLLPTPADVTPLPFAPHTRASLFHLLRLSLEHFHSFPVLERFNERENLHTFVLNRTPFCSINNNSSSSNSSSSSSDEPKPAPPPTRQCPFAAKGKDNQGNAHRPPPHQVTHEHNDACKTEKSPRIWGAGLRRCAGQQLASTVLSVFFACLLPTETPTDTPPPPSPSPSPLPQHANKDAETVHQEKGDADADADGDGENNSATATSRSYCQGEDLPGTLDVRRACVVVDALDGLRYSGRLNDAQPPTLETILTHVVRIAYACFLLVLMRISVFLGRTGRVSRHGADSRKVVLWYDDPKAWVILNAFSSQASKDASTSCIDTTT